MRRISNLNDILNMANREFPVVVWEMLYSGPSVVANAKYFNKVSLLFATHGGGVANIVFMQPKTVLCEVEGKSFRANFMGITQIIGLFHVIVRLAAIRHYFWRPTFMPLPLARETIKAGLRCLGLLDKV
jgi:hypothetical protein